MRHSHSTEPRFRIHPRILAVLRPLKELLYLVAGYCIYAWIRNRVGKATALADFIRARGHAERLVGWERDLGLYIEPRVQHALLPHPLLIRALDTYWSYGYLIMTPAVIVWLMWRHPDRFPRLRRAMFGSTLVALLIFALWPTVPPRLLPVRYKIVDTWARFGGIHARNSPRIERISDPFASFPSLHVAWAIWCAAAVAMVAGSLLLRIVVWIYPSMTILAVIGTGNHYVLDCIVGGSLMAVALAAEPALRLLTAMVRPVRAVAVTVAVPAEVEPALFDPM